jgi:phosphoribosylformylglycinamidine synthase PurS subunit
MSRVVITIMPRAEVLDPQGQAVERALRGLDFSSAEGVRVGKRIELEIDAADPEAEARRMCDALLANPLIEDFDVEIG